MHKVVALNVACIAKKLISPFFVLFSNVDILKKLKSRHIHWRCNIKQRSLVFWEIKQSQVSLSKKYKYLLLKYGNLFLIFFLSTLADILTLIINSLLFANFSQTSLLLHFVIFSSQVNLSWFKNIYIHYIANSIGTPSNERFDYCSNIHDYKS